MPKKIFLVEDDRDYSQFIKVKLQNTYEVETFSNAEDCSKALQVTTPDVLILDYYLPGMSGIELYDKIKNTLSERVKVIVLSSLDDILLYTEIIKKGIREYVIKDDNVISALIDAIEGDEDDSIDKFFEN